MKPLALLAALMFTATVAASAAEKDQRIYLLSSITAKPGKLDEIHALIRDRLMPPLAKLGLPTLGVFVPVENGAGKIISVSAFASPEAAEKFKDAVDNDDAVKAGLAQLHELAADAPNEPQRVLMATDFSPAVTVAAGPGARVFELRTYTATPGNLPLLHARFRDHTLALFAKHGMTNLWYWQPVPQQKDVDRTLVYLLAHASVDAAKASFDAFRTDPDWIAAKAASEEKGGGSLTMPDGVKSVFLKATDYSPLK